MPSATLTPSCNSAALASKLSNYAVGHNIPAGQVQAVAREMGVDEGTVVAVTDDPVIVARELVASAGVNEAGEFVQRSNTELVELAALNADVVLNSNDPRARMIRAVQKEKEAGQRISENVLAALWSIETLRKDGESISEEEEEQMVEGAVERALDEMVTQIESVPNGKNTLVVLLYGAGQVPGDTEDTPGFDNLKLQLSDLEHVLTIRSANLPIIDNPDQLTINAALNDIKIAISDYVKAYPEVDSIIIGGYSRGGGQTYEVAKWLAYESNLNLSILGTAYVDAVTASSDSAWHPEGRMPPTTKSLLNIYQSVTSPLQDSFLELHGTKISGIEYLGLESVQQIDLDAHGIEQTHGSIDEYAVPFVRDYILKALSFCNM